MKYVVRLPARRVGPIVENGAETIAVGREISIADGDVIGFVLGYAAAHGNTTIKVIDAAVPERHRRMQLLRDAQDVGLLTYLGVVDSADETSREEGQTP